MDIEFLSNVTLYLLAAVVSVPLAQRCGLGSVLGYLFAGMIIGPHILGLINHPEEVMHFSEFGVVLLLFLIGLELNPSQLWRMRQPIVGIGGLQVVATTAALTAIGWLLGADFTTALIVGMALSLSSTAIALQTLREKHLGDTRAGRSGFAVLLFQDIAVIPMIAIIPLLSSGEAVDSPDNLPLAIAQVFAVITAIILGGRLLLRPLFRIVAATNLREIFTAFSLLIVIGIALAMHSVGMSMALGTFMAGVLLADSEYRHELEIAIEPFKGLLLGLFFIAVGMAVDLDLLVAEPLVVIGLAVGLVAVKGLLLLPIGRMAGGCGSDTTLFAVLLAQGGEFAFVLFAAAGNAGVLAPALADRLVVAVTLSMVATPLLMIFQEKYLAPRFNRGQQKPYDSLEGIEQAQVIIAGYGRFGQMVGRLLHSKHIPITVLDHDSNQVELLRRFGWPAFYGDATRLDLLEKAGAEQAKLLILAIDDIPAALSTAKLVQERFPHLQIMARVKNRQEVYRFMKLGIPVIVRETFGSALEMGEEAFKYLGYSPEQAQNLVQQFRAHDLATIQMLYPHHQDEKALIGMSKAARTDLERIMNEEALELKEETLRERIDQQISGVMAATEEHQGDK